VFRVDPRIAWQLFPDADAPDAATTSRVAALVGRLDDDDFRTREDATAELEVLGGAAVRALEDVPRDGLSAEQNARIDAVLARYTQLEPDEADRLRGDPHFLLRCFAYCDLPPVRAAAVTALRRVLGKYVELDASDEPAARARAAETLRATLPELGDR
jgi:hypothetical protein